MALEKNPRACALESLVEWEQQIRNPSPGYYARDIFDSKLAKFSLSPVDQALARELFFGVLRNRSLLDQYIKKLRTRGSVKITPKCLLRIGLYQIFQTKIADHAAVNETVSLASKHERGLVNAILRNALRQSDALLTESKTWPLHEQLSHPKFLVTRWSQQFDQSTARDLCQWNNQPPPIYARVCDEVALDQASQYQFEKIDAFPDFVRLPPGPLPMDLIDKGILYIQDPSTATACWLLAPMPGETILDACAAPGGKTGLLHSMCSSETKLFATDSNPRRIDRLRQNLDRLEIDDVEIRQIDWQDPDPEALATLPKFDAILLDVPCSNTGVMRRRVDVRWRLQKSDFTQLNELQLAIIANATRQLKPGGRIVYSTCSIDPQENQQTIENSDLRIIETRKSFPLETGFDGAFAALLKKD